MKKKIKKLLTKYSVPELATKLGCTVSSIYAWCNKREPMPIFRNKIEELYQEALKDRLTK